MRLVVSGLIFAAVLVLGLFGYRLTHKTPGAPVPVAVTTAYLVAAHPVPPGTLARNEDFVAKTVATGDLPDGAIADTAEARADVRGAMIRRFIEPGAPLLAADFIRPRDRGFLAAVLAPDTRAVSIGVTAISGVAGLIWPGDHVDVLLTQDIAQPGERVSHVVTSETVMANARVIAVNQDIAQGAPANGTSAGRATTTVTLQTNVDQAERLAVATNLGHLSLAVRSADNVQVPNDATGIAVSGTDVSQALSKASLTTGTHVQVIQGGQRSEVLFK